MDEKPRSVVLYVDSFLAIFSSILMYHESEDKKKCDSINTYMTYSTKKSDYCSLDAELGDFDSVLGYMNVGGQIKMYDKTLQQNNVTYPSIELYDAYRQSL